MEIKRAGSQPSGKGPAEYFTGTVRIDPLNNPPDPARVAMALVTFEPGARTAWHTHPFGQTLIVTAGSGRVQREGGPVEEIRPGDVVWFAPGEKHWHGAAPTTAMSHIAIQEKLDGSPVDWMEHVSDAQYGAYMPHVIIKLARGRSDEQKTKLADAVTKAVTDGARVPDSAVSVAIEDVEPDRLDRRSLPAAHPGPLGATL